MNAIQRCIKELVTEMDAAEAKASEFKYEHDETQQRYQEGLVEGLISGVNALQRLRKELQAARRRRRKG